MTGASARRGRIAAAILFIALATGCEDQAPRAEAPSAEPASIQQTGSGFDFWVLSLAWSPSYCEIEGPDANRTQCASGRRLGFVVHGLWPQFDKGWPEYCENTEPDRVPDGLVRAYLDIIPSAGLIGHQWRKHGTCSGLDQRDYLAVTRAASERVTVPRRFVRPTSPLKLDPDDIEAEFLRANEGLVAGGIAVTCDAGLVGEVRICMTTGLEFRPCPEVDARSCRAANATMPAPGG